MQVLLAAPNVMPHRRAHEATPAVEVIAVSTPAMPRPGSHPDAREAIICAAWGSGTDWVRNLRAGPAARVRLGRESFTPQHRFLSDDEAFDVAVQFRREHPRRLRLLSTILGWGDLRDDAAVRGFIRTRPFVAFRPAPASP